MLNWIRANKLKVFKVGNRYRIKRQDLERFTRSHGFSEGMGETEIRIDTRRTDADFRQ